MGGSIGVPPLMTTQAPSLRAYIWPSFGASGQAPGGPCGPGTPAGPGGPAGPAGPCWPPGDTQVASSRKTRPDSVSGAGTRPTFVRLKTCVGALGACAIIASNAFSTTFAYCCYTKHDNPHRHHN